MPQGLCSATLLGCMFKIVTWNFNSVAMRKDRLLAFLERERPDALCLQELKCIDEKFPMGEINDAGYHASVFGQKAYNGVAVITKQKPLKVQRNFGAPLDDEASRFIAVKLPEGIWVMSAYCPNGQALGTEKFAYKLDWFIRLRRYLDSNHNRTEKIALVGDFNITPEDADVYDPIALKEQIHTSSQERAALKQVVGFGFYDTFRLHHKEAGLFSWWDYRQMAFPQNRGLRIDMIYATPPLAQQSTGARIDREERKGDKPSDHAPVIADFDLSIT